MLDAFQAFRNLLPAAGLPSQRYTSMSSTIDQSNKASDASEHDDCIPCRLTGAFRLRRIQRFLPAFVIADHSTGSATFVGLGVYILTLRMDPPSLGVSDSSKAVSRMLSKQGPRIRGGLGATFVLLGMYRLIN